MKKLMFFALLAFLSIGIQAQDNQYLRELTQTVKKLRKARSKEQKQIIADLAMEKNPKIALMDDIEGGGAEYDGPEANRFFMNQVFAFVYEKQNHKMESNSVFLSSKEKGINYSGIEKSIKKGGRVKYTIDGHKGRQEFVFIPYHPDTKYKVTISDDFRKPIEKEATDVYAIKYPNVGESETISITIEYLGSKSNKEAFESFAILNYNPQKR